MASQLDPLTLGLVLAGLGMGGTLLTLFVLSLIVDLLKRLFPEGDRGQGLGVGERNSQVAANPQPPASPQPPVPNPEQGREAEP